MRNLSDKAIAKSTKQDRTLSKAWYVVLLIAVALTLAFAILNLINSTYTFVQLISMLVTTFPIIIMVVVGVAFAFGGKKRR